MSLTVIAQQINQQQPLSLPFSLLGKHLDVFTVSDVGVLRHAGVLLWFGFIRQFIPRDRSESASARIHTRGYFG